MIIYLFKSSICLAVFMAFYKLFLEKESIHHFKRFYLLGSIVISIVIPFITFTEYIEVVTTQNFNPFQPSEFTNTASLTPEVITTTRHNYMPNILWSIYIIGVLLFSARFVLNIRTILHRIKANPKHQYHEFTNVLLQDLIHPHTFFKYIFLNKTKYEHNLIPNEVMLHEQTHAKQKHALDILCIEVLQIIFWFNPLLYFIKKDIKLNHEFLADQAVLQKGIDTAQYKQILLTFSSHSSEPQLTNAVNYSLIKKRFAVMKSNTSKQAFWLRSLLLLPMLAFLIYSFSEKEIVEKEVTLVESSAIQQVSTDKGASEAMMKEYREFIKDWKITNRIIYPKLQRAIAIYDIMSPSQKATVKMYPKTFFPSSLSKVKPKTPSEAEYNSWKNKKEFAIWIDGKNVSNETLNNYTSSDISYYTVSKVYKNAQTKKHPQPFQNNLYTKIGFEETYLKSGVKKYNHLKSKYLKSIKDNSLSNDELRILKTQVDKAYNVLTKEEIEKYGVEKLTSSKITDNNKEIVTRDQVIEYNKLWDHSSQEFHYTQQTFWVKNKKGKKIAKKYYELSEKGKKRWLQFPPTIYTKKQISKEEFKKLFDESTYVIRINGVVTDKIELKKYKNTDFVSFSKNDISELAELRQKYHYNLFTDSGYETNLLYKRPIDQHNSKTTHLETKNKKQIQEKVTSEMIAEYNTLAKNLNTKLIKKDVIVKQKDVERMSYIFGLMTAEQKKNAEPYPEKIGPEIRMFNKNHNNVPPPPPAPKNAKTGYTNINGEKIHYQTINGKTKYWDKWGSKVNSKGEIIISNILKTTNKDVKLLKHWFITIDGEKYYYPTNSSIKKYYDKYGNEANFDIVKEYKKKNNLYESLKTNGKHFVFKPEAEQKTLRTLSSDLGGIYFRMSKSNKENVKRPESLYYPYVKITKENGEHYYKKRGELTEEDKKLLPPPPQKKKVKKQVINFHINKTEDILINNNKTAINKLEKNIDGLIGNLSFEEINSSIIANITTDNGVHYKKYADLKNALRNYVILKISTSNQ